MNKYFRFSKNYLIISLLIIFPYLYLFPLTFGYLVMGNDFEGLYYSYKKFIFDFFIQDIFIYWSPSESTGYSLIYNPFAQYFYIPSWLLLFFHKIFEIDFTRHNYLIFTIFAISIFNVGNYLWLRRLNFSPSTALLSCLIISMNLKISEILRFPNAIHTFCWFSWILYGLTLTKFQKKTLKSFVILFVCWLFITTAGYPYYIIYSCILFSFYFILISSKHFDIFLNIKEKKNNLISSFFNSFLPIFFSSIIVSPWLFKIYEIMTLTRDRNLKNLDFTSSLNSNFFDHIGSWAMPTISIAEGWFYNGIIFTFLIIFFLVGIVLNFRKKNKYFLLSLSIFYLIIFELSKAGDSLLFSFIVEKIDFLKNMRAWSRINIILIPFLTVLIALSINFFKEKAISKTHIIIFTLIIILLLTFQFYYNDYEFNSYWQVWQGRRINFVKEWFAEDFSLLSTFVNLYHGKIYFIFGLISFFIIIFMTGINFKISKNIKMFSYVFITMIFSELFFLSNIQWALPGSSWSKKYTNEKDIITALNESFNKPSYLGRVYGNEYYKKDKKFIVNYIENFGFENHSRVFDEYLNRNGKTLSSKSQKEINDFKIFFGANEIGEVKRLFFTKSINYSNIHDFIRDAKNLYSNNVKIEKKYYSGNKLELNVISNYKGYITYVSNYDPNWFAKINDKDVEIVKFLNSYKSIKIDQGKSKIIFYYYPWQIKF